VLTLPRNVLSVIKAKVQNGHYKAGAPSPGTTGGHWTLCGIFWNHSEAWDLSQIEDCWLDTELANTDKERSVVAKGGAIIVINFNSKLVQSKE
jgi:hypothetical protein